MTFSGEFGVQMNVCVSTSTRSKISNGIIQELVDESNRVGKGVTRMMNMS